MNIFPCFWSQPLPRHWKPVKSLAAHHFPPKTLKISAPERNGSHNYADNDLGEEASKQFMPACEMLKPGEEVDLTAVDAMLLAMDDPSDAAKTKQIMQTITMVSDNLQKNIKVIQNAPTVEGDTVSRKDILKLLQGFLNFARTIEAHIKETQCCC